MAVRAPAVPFFDFRGGLNTADPEYNMPLNQSPDEDNVLTTEKGFYKRNGDNEWNSSAMISSVTAVAGLGYLKLNNGNEFLNAVAGTKFFVDATLIGTMTDSTGAITITSGQNNIWTPVIYNNIQIWFGGAPDAPFKYSGTGNAAALGGTPPSATTAFVANNRVFAIRTAAAPSRIQWPVLSDPEDWTGAGSGSSDVSKSDGEALQCGVVTGPDTAILFKNSSTHMMVLTRAPFPIYQLQKGIGVAGHNAWAYANGIIYIVTPGKRMKSTMDGVNFKSYPDHIDSIWDTINALRIPYIQGIYYQALELIIWCVSTGSNTTNDLLIVWDIRRECFLQCTTGFKTNIFCILQNRRLFGGHYNGKIYEKFKAIQFVDDSETSPGAINAYWRTPYSGLGADIDATVHPLYLDVVALTETASSLDINYGFDFISPSLGGTFSLIALGSLWDVALWDVDVWGGQNATVLKQFVSGRGNLFSFRLSNATASQGFTVQGASVRLRTDKARKLLTNV